MMNGGSFERRLKDRLCCRLVMTKPFHTTLLLVSATIAAVSAVSSGRGGQLLLDTHGEGHRGAIVPAERIPRWLGKPSDAWTPTREDARRAEAGLRAHLEWGVANRERFEPAEDWYVREQLPSVFNRLSTFTRYYMGRSTRAEGRHVLVIGIHDSYTRVGGRDMWLTGLRVYGT